MTRDEIRALLALAAAMESRGWAPTGIDVDAWTLVLADVGAFDDARDAIVGHYRESRFRVTPAEVRTGALAIARQRAGHVRAGQLALPAPAPQRATTPPAEWYELRKRMAARAARRDREPATFGEAMAAMAEHLEPAAEPTAGPT